MSTDRNVARRHAEWLNMVEASGPFLSMPVLLECFPHGLDVAGDESTIRHRVSQAYEEWADNQQGNRADPAIHTQWLHFVLEEVLELRPEVILEGQQIPSDLRHDVKEHGETLRPQLVIRSPYEQKNRLFVQLYPHTQDLNKALPEKKWKVSPATRIMELLRNTGVRLGLLTNGRQWMLVDAPPNETSGYYTWDASLWSEEPLTLLAFRNLLGMERFFNVPDDQTLEEMLTKSAQKQQEVTDQLGDQVRRAVETLVHTLDRLDKEQQKTLLQDINEKDLYQAALTVMMRLVFLLSAEERDMLRLGEPLYDQNYAASTLHKQLREHADQYGEEVLGLRYDAWSRLLALFRIIYGGVEHIDLRMPAYGGRLFDPDRFPFLEGRTSGTSWRDTPANPLHIDNRTVLHLLNALQYLQVKVPGGGVEPRRLSFRGLDIEQIGHVYEGLLDHTARKAETTILGLIGTGDSEPETTLEKLEEHASKGEAELLKYLASVTSRNEKTIQKNLAQTLETQDERSHLMGACDNQQQIFDRILPYAGLLRKDTFDQFVIVTPGSVYVTKGSDRRSTGTHYTPRSLTEPIVQHALDPLVYIGPAEGLPQEEWKLRSAGEILDLKICDMAMGSGAFLVQACRYLSEKLVEAWENIDRELNVNNGKHPTPQIADLGELSQGVPSEKLLAVDTEERLSMARRIIAGRCLYGVDKNPMAVEMARLSLWLITLAKDKPFTFLDHNLRSGDSLLGADERQLYNGSLDAESGVVSQMSQVRYAMQYVMPTVIQKRRQIASLSANSIRNIEEQERLLKEADQALEIVKLGADLIVGLALTEAKRRESLLGTIGLEYMVLAKAYDEALNQRQTEFGWQAKKEAFAKLRKEINEVLKRRKPFHWPLEFPEVFVGKGDDAGFAAIVGNPPFQGGQKITGALGTDYRDYLIKYLASGKRGSADLCAYFFLRATKLASQESSIALIATNSIAQGDTREVGLDQILGEKWTIIRAVPSRKWPGEASLEVAYVWLKKGEWNGSSILDDKPASNISSLLTTSENLLEKPNKLLSNANKSFQGSIILGMGFILDPKEAQALIEKDVRNKDVIFPYLNGEDLNSRPDQSPSRWVINFQDWPLEKAEAYINGIKIVREKVKPERDHNNRQVYREKWWQYAEKRPKLYATIANMRRVLAIPLVSKYMVCAWEPSNIIYSHALGIITTESNADFAIIQCTFHDEWARANGSTLETRMRYTPSDCFETFPFPLTTERLDDIGQHYYNHRQSIMLTRQEGLTKTYNRFHNPDEHSPDIVQLRELHKEMDEAVARAYGWDNLKLEHGFHETKQGLRYTISEAARREVLDRLLALNHQRHEEEVAAGLFETKAAKGKTAKGKTTRTKKATSIEITSDNGDNKEKNVILHTIEDGQVEAIDNPDLEQGTLFPVEGGVKQSRLF